MGRRRRLLTSTSLRAACGLGCSGTCSRQQAEALSLDRSTCFRATSFETGASSRRRRGSTHRHVGDGRLLSLLRVAKVPTLLRETILGGMCWGCLLRACPRACLFVHRARRFPQENARRLSNRQAAAAAWRPFSGHPTVPGCRPSPHRAMLAQGASVLSSSSSLPAPGCALPFRAAPPFVPPPAKRRFPRRALGTLPGRALLLRMLRSVRRAKSSETLRWPLANLPRREMCDQTRTEIIDRCMIDSHASCRRVTSLTL